MPKRYTDMSLGVRLTWAINCWPALARRKRKKDIALERRTSATIGWSTLVRPKRKTAMSLGVRRTRARLPLPRQSAKRICPKRTLHAVH